VGGGIGECGVEGEAATAGIGREDGAPDRDVEGEGFGGGARMAMVSVWVSNSRQPSGVR
jgi:hypothetical protein